MKLTSREIKSLQNDNLLLNNKIKETSVEYLYDLYLQINKDISIVRPLKDEPEYLTSEEAVEEWNYYTYLKVDLGRQIEQLNNSNVNINNKVYYSFLFNDAIKQADSYQKQTYNKKKTYNIAYSDEKRKEHKEKLNSMTEEEIIQCAKGDIDVINHFRNRDKSIYTEDTYLLLKKIYEKELEESKDFLNTNKDIDITDKENLFAKYQAEDTVLYSIEVLNMIEESLKEYENQNGK